MLIAIIALSIALFLLLFLVIRADREISELRDSYNGAIALAQAYHEQIHSLIDPEQAKFDSQ